MAADACDQCHRNIQESEIGPCSLGRVNWAQYLARCFSNVDSGVPALNLENLRTFQYLGQYRAGRRAADIKTQCRPLGSTPRARWRFSAEVAVLGH